MTPIDVEKLVTIAENEQKVYKAGRDVVWDGVQRNGERTKYDTVSGFFNGTIYNFTWFYPLYDIRPEGDASHLFYNWRKSKESLSERLKECGVVLDTSKATKLTNAFAYTYITEIPTIDCTGLVGASNDVFAYGYMNLEKIEKIIVNESTTFTGWFTNSLPIEIRFEGVIGQDLSLTYSNGIDWLSVDSTKNIISCLKNYKGTDEEFTHTLTLRELFWTKLEQSGTAPDGGTWRDYVASLGWNT